jgi:hypothetical protein
MLKESNKALKPARVDTPDIFLVITLGLPSATCANGSCGRLVSHPGGVDRAGHGIHAVAMMVPERFPSPSTAKISYR